MNYHTVPRRAILSNAEVRTALARLMTADGRRLGHGRMTRLSALCGVSRWTLKDIKDGHDPASEELRAALTKYIPMLERGELVFHRRVTGGVTCREVEWDAEYLAPPNPLPPPQPRVVPGTDFRQWARCISCGFPRFSKFTSDKVYMACDGCVSEADRAMLGHRP